MERVNIAEARERLEELIDRAAAGETIVIAREGRGAVRLEAEAVPKSRRLFDAEKHLRWLERAPIDGRNPQEIDADLRSLDRY